MQTSKEIIKEVKDRFEELKHKKFDWRSFYNGYLEAKTKMNKIEEFYKELGGVEYDKFDKKADKFTYYDMIEFADEYNKRRLTDFLKDFFKGIKDVSDEDIRLKVEKYLSKP